MTAYAIAIIRSTRFGDDIRRYLERIDATLAPFGGHYLLHGGSNTVLEGADPGQLVMIGFPSMQHAHEWYASDVYAAIRALRTDNTEGDLILLQGVEAGHKAIDILG